MFINVHHYLHECVTGTVCAEHTTEEKIKFTFDDGSVYSLQHDHRDKRALVVFDGELLFGGLPKNAQVIYGESLGPISCDSTNVRKDPYFTCAAFPKYEYNGTKTSIEIFRYFILLPSCNAIVRKYRHKNLSPIYVTIRVYNGKNDKKIVEWNTTSF